MTATDTKSLKSQTEPWTQPRTSAPEHEVVVGSNALRGLLAKAALVAIVPAILVFSWMAFLREPTLRSDSATVIAEAVVVARAAVVTEYIEDATRRVENLALTLPADTPAGDFDPIKAGFPDALTVVAIPLDEMGTASLELGNLGLETHISIDVIRKAFVGDSPQPEMVVQSETPFALIARPYGDPAQGVILVKLKTDRIERMLADTSAGRFELIQTLPGKSGKVVVGSASNQETASALAAVTTAPWQLRFSPSDTWLEALLPNYLPLIAAAGLGLLGVLVAGLIMLLGVPRLLRNEANHIAESAELHTTLKLSVPALLPLAKMLRQLSLVSRRQLVSHARREANKEDTKVKPKAPPPPATEVSETEDAVVENAAPVQTPSDNISDPLDALFRPAGIRGDTNTELTDEVIDKVGNALAVLAKDRGITTFALAHDCRSSSKDIRSRLARAMLAGGIDIIDIGEAPSPLLYYAIHETDAQSGVMITGGHSNEHINGLKISLNRQPMSAEDMNALLALVKTGARTNGTGRMAKQDVAPDYIDRIALDIALALPLKVIVDTNFGTAAGVVPDMLEALDCDIVSFNSPAEGQRPEDWRLESALAALGERVTKEGADIGMLFDSDADRLYTVAENGELIETDRLLMLLARDVLERNPGADVIYDVRFSRHFAPFIARCGGRALMSRTGRAFVANSMQKSGALLGGEFSGHLFFKERWYGFEDALYGAARLLELLSAASGTYTELAAELPQAVSSPEITLPLGADARHQLLKRLSDTAEFPQARLTKLDGLRVDYADGWGLVRNSASEDALSFRFEGNDETSLARVQGVIRRAVLQIAPDLALPF